MLVIASPDSVAFSLNGFKIYYYGICMSLAVLCGFSLSYCIAKKYYKEYYKVNNTDMYISNGLGTTIMNLRLFNKPSISLYRLTN